MYRIPRYMVRGAFAAIWACSNIKLDAIDLELIEVEINRTTEGQAHTPRGSV